MKKQQRDASGDFSASLHKLLDDLLAVADTTSNSTLCSPSDDDGAMVEDGEDNVGGEYNEGDSELTLSPGTSDHSASDGAEQPASPTPRVRKRMRHEVLRLQETVAGLETQLCALERRLATELPEDSTGDEDGDASTNKRRRLQRSAQQQIQAATRARLENAKLCDAARAQAELAFAVQEVLVRQRRQLEGLDDEEPRGYVAPATFAAVLSPRERAIYSRLSDRVNVRSADLETVLARPQNSYNATLADQPVAQGAVLWSEQQSMCIEFVMRYVIPFDYKDGARVLWTQVLSRIPKVTSCASHTEVITSTDYVIATKHSATSTYLASDIAPLTTEYALSKRMAKAARAEFVWEAHTESNREAAVVLRSPSASPLIDFVEEGWASVAHIDTRRGSSPASVVEAHIRLTLSAATDSSNANSERDRHPHLSKQEERQQLDVGALSRDVISILEKKTAVLRCYMESSLLDESLRRFRAAGAK